jgi:hypothetical protein
VADTGAEQVRNVCVELVRAGPPHNQLLSPLTRYLALCGDAQAGELTMPYEHAELIHRLRELEYRSAAEQRRQEESQRDRQYTQYQLSRDMSRLLADVPGLRSQLVGHQCKTDLVHLQLVVTAAELAMLPFEFAGTLESNGNEPGNYLLLNPKPRVSLTRRLRTASGACVHWARKPKLLFVSAEPEASVPFHEHLDALIRVLQPWLPPLDGPAGDAANPTDAYREALNDVLQVIEHATIAKISQACSETSFTHIHVLAHGATDPSSPGRHFGIALHANDFDKAHVVSGAQFATAIRRDGGGPGPTVVTLASCDSGNISNVEYTGASFVHDLHRAGVPFVVGSQFRLSKIGSIMLCEKLYAKLLLGDDPRQVLCDLRLRLHSLYGGTTHDWASVVVYAALPDDFETQLEDLRYQQARASMNVALAHLDRQVDKIHDWKKELERPWEALIERVEGAIMRLPTSGRYDTEGLGLTAASKKRIAEALFRAAAPDGTTAGPGGSSVRREPLPDASELLVRSVQYLEEALLGYTRAFEEGARFREDHNRAMAPLHWASTQRLSLELVLGRNVHADLFPTTSAIATTDLNRGERAAQIWALTSLLEMELLDAWRAGPSGTEQAHVEHMGGYWERLFATSSGDTSAIYSTRQQLKRYTEWWWTTTFKAARGVGQRPPVPETLNVAVKNVIEQMDAYLRNHPQAKVGRRR